MGMPTRSAPFGGELQPVVVRLAEVLVEERGLVVEHGLAERVDADSGEREVADHSEGVVPGAEARDVAHAQPVGHGVVRVFAEAPAHLRGVNYFCGRQI